MTFGAKLKALIIYWIYRLLMITWKYRVHEGPDFQAALKSNQPFILAHFHGDELALLYLVTKYKLATMVSKSKDGEIMNLMYSKLGGATSRGSSSRGSIGALKGLIRLMKKSGYSTSIAVDGPRGPIHKAKPGVFELSRLTHSPIFTLGVYAEQKFVSNKSWNKAILPKPFSTIQVTILQPMTTVEKSQDPKSKELAEKLELQLFNARRQACKLIESPNH
ncbi:MAG: DUF374 domain-containing protein [Bdellovibrionaceae bacterium]|jgi:lysophospholipid acyltransferase (LPLAT)-like uncharacterized protein|nr:DUF374 domain-containing protein [Pseudobdellovibrionaceae bacterium]